MAKAKQAKPRDPKELPPRPPADLSEAVLFGAASEITAQVESDYVAAIYHQGSRARSKK